MMDAKHKSLFVALILVALLAAGGTLVYVDQNLRARALADADAALNTRARSLAYGIDRTLRWRMEQAFAFAALPSFRGFATADPTTQALRSAIALNELKSIAASDPTVRATSIVDTSGAVVLTTDDSMNAYWGERDFVQEALAGHLYGSVPSRDNGEISQYYSAPILDNRGQVSGALVLRVAASELWGAASSPCECFLVDEDDVRIADWSSSPSIFVALAPLPASAAASTARGNRYGTQETQIPALNLGSLAAQIDRAQAATLSFRDANGQSNRAAIQRLTVRPWTAVVFASEVSIYSFEGQEILGTLGFAAIALASATLVVFTIRVMGRQR